MRSRMRFGRAARKRLGVAAGAVVLAFGAIVLARAPSAARAPDEAPPDGADPDGASRVTAEGSHRISIVTPEMSGFLALTQGAVLAHGTRELFAELRLEATDEGGVTARRPVALAVVLDTSGSMMGEKIADARRAVHALAESMRPEDRLAIVTYDHGARLVQPLAPIAEVRRTLSARVNEIYASGGTNIPAGLQLGSTALSDAPANMTHRLVLISDGLDGSGQPLGSVQAQIAGRANGGVTTSALGVGIDYDERWLTTVADAGRGNYEFLADGGALGGFLHRELEQASTTVADAASVDLQLPPGWRVTHAYGGSFEQGRVPLGALFAGERRRVTLRMEIDAGAAGEVRAVGARLAFRSAIHGSDRNLDLGRLSVSTVNEEGHVADSRDVALHAEAIAQHVDARQAQAIEAWREGRAAEAREIAADNLATLEEWQRAAPAAAPALRTRAAAASRDMDNFQLDARSAGGRAYGLESNARRRSRAQAY